MRKFAMNDGFRPYLRDRMIKECDGFVVIVPADADPVVPLCCSVCDHMMKSRDDETAYLEFGCCDRCARLWAQPRRQAWHDGWRPTPDQVGEAELDRPPMSITFDVD